MSRRVLFFAPFGAWRVHTQVDAVLATALQLRGAEVLIAGCDGIYPACDVLAWSGPHAREACAACAAGGREFFGRFGHTPSQLREWLRPEDFSEAEQFAAAVAPEQYATAEWNGLPLGRWVTSSVYTYFRITSAGLARPEVRDVHRRFLAGAVLTWKALSRLGDQFQPAVACIFNARMAAFRVAFEWARSRGLRPLVHERGAFDDTFNLFDNEDCLSTRPLKQAAGAWQDVPLTREQCVTVRTYLARREGGQGMNFPSFYGYRTEYAGVRRALRIPEEAKVLLVLTSSEFELACSEHFQSMAGQMEFLDRLIEVFRGRKEFLVIRHHPHIGGMREAAPDYEFIGRAWRQAARAPENVRCILPAEALSSYALFWNVDACISFFSSAGFEAAGRGLAAAAFPESHYHQALSLSLEGTAPDSLDRLVTGLFARTETFGIPDLRKLYRFVHTFLARLPKRFKAFGIRNHFEEDLRFRSRQELLPGNDAELDRVSDHLLNDAPLMPLPSPEDRARGPQAEEEFLTEELEQLRQRRTSVRTASRRRAAWALSPRVAMVRVRSESEPGEDRFVAYARRRHAVTREYECAAGRDWRQSLQALARVLDEIVEPYVLVSNRGMVHGEALLPSALDCLLQDSDCAFKGILFGIYRADRAGNPEGELFTQRVPAGSFEEAIRLFPEFRHPELLLGLGLFRHEALVELLQECCGAVDGPAAARQIFAAFQGPGFRREPLPMSVILAGGES